jgi:ubiquitin carboxyl-terminal hydrolase 34
MKDPAHVADANANADSAEPAIASPPAPARDPVEDADASFTRKRPRLDSGSNSLRALSHDTAEDLPLPFPEDTTAASPRDRDRDQQVEMTIRPHPSSSPVLAATPDGPNANGFVKDLQVMIIEDDDDEASPPGYVVQIDAEDYFRRFPFSRMGPYPQAILDLPQYVSGCKSAPDCCIWPLLTLDSHRHRRPHPPSPDNLAHSPPRTVRRH